MGEARFRALTHLWFILWFILGLIVEMGEARFRALTQVCSFCNALCFSVEMGESPKVITIEIPDIASHIITQKAYDDIIASLKLTDIQCPCEHTGSLIFHGSYKRTIKTPEGDFWLQICRVKSTHCGHTHAILLSSVVPYSQIPIKEQVDIICSYEKKSSYAEILSSHLSIDENNIRSIILRYRLFWQKTIRLLHLSFTEDTIFGFFTEWVSVRYLNLLQDILESRMGEMPDAVTVEFFPNKGRLKNGKAGQAIKLPFGYHAKTGRQSRFLDEDFLPVQNPGKFIMDMGGYTGLALKKILNAAAPAKSVAVKENKMDEDLGSFGYLPDNIAVILTRCNLMRYLCQKARSTGYLSHFERLSVLYVFGHVGEDGKAFVHKVMEFTFYSRPPEFTNLPTVNIYGWRSFVVGYCKFRRHAV